MHGESLAACVFEVRVKVSFVDESKLVLVNIDAPDQIERGVQELSPCFGFGKAHQPG